MEVNFEEKATEYFIFKYFEENQIVNNPIEECECEFICGKDDKNSFLRNKAANRG